MGTKALTGLLAAVAAVAALAITPASAGWIMVDQAGRTSFIEGGKIRSAWGDGRVVLDAAAREIVFVDDGRRLVSRGAVDEYCRIVSGSETAKKAPAAAASVLISGPEPGEAVAGFETNKYRVSVDGELYEEVWLADDKDLLKDLGALLEALPAFAACRGGLGTRTGAAETTAEYLAMLQKGWKIRSVRYENGAPLATTRVVILRKQEIPAAEFSPPAGYAGVPFADLLEEPEGAGAAE